MSEYYQEMLWELANHSFDCGAFHGTDGAKQARDLYDKVEAALIERDCILTNALKAIAAIEDKMVGGDWEEIQEAREIANKALKEIGEME